MEFVPLGYLLREFWLFLSAQPLLKEFFPNSGLIVRPHRAKMSDKLLESLVFAKCSIFRLL